jgi:hypothetical protein
MRTRLFVLPVLLALGACSSDPQPTYVARVDSPETLPVGAPDASLMLVQMPAPGGLVTNVRERTYPNGVMQQAVLEHGGAGIGENKLEISVQTAPAVGAGMLTIGPPSQDAIRREILARYPKVEMRIVTQPRQNALGVFGLAIGRAGNGARCIFAWQWVDTIRGRSGGGSIFGGRASEGATPASIRVHLCRRDATVDDLAATVEGMTLAAPAIVERALDSARRVAATVPMRATDPVVTASMAPAAGSLESALVPQRQIASAGAPRARKATRVAKRRAPAQPANEDIVERSPAVAQQPPYGGGPRYLAPVAGARSGPATYASPAPMAAAAAPQTGGLDPSLPAAAYRGPSYRGN